MEIALMLSQTVFYFVTSFAIIMIGVILCVIAYYASQIGQRLRNISENVEKSSDEVRENIKDFFDKLSEIPFMSSFFKKGRSKKG
jgi:ABC-type multidrug transport system fused ATPase/permease subunit